MKKWLELEAFCLRNAISTRLQYRIDFFISSIGLGLAQIAIPIFMLLIYSVSAGFPGWSMGEAILLTGYISLAEAISVVFIQGIIGETTKNIREGTMDTWLLAPTNTLGYIINRSVDVEGIGRLFFSSAVTVYALTLIQPTLAQILLFILYLSVPVMLFSSLYIFASASSIKHVQTERVYEVLHFITVFGKYPSSIYPQALRLIILSIIPVAAMGSVPIEVILAGKTPILLLSAVSVIIFCSVSVTYWNHTIKYYTSANG